jgi:hypothetical protein
LIQALEDLANEAPGIGAVLQLHQELVDAAAMNPDPWTLSRLVMEVHISIRFSQLYD